MTVTKHNVHNIEFALTALESPLGSNKFPVSITVTPLHVLVNMPLRYWTNHNRYPHTISPTEEIERITSAVRRGLEDVIESTQQASH